MELWEKKLAEFCIKNGDISLEQMEEIFSIQKQTPQKNILHIFSEYIRLQPDHLYEICQKALANFLPQQQLDSILASIGNQASSIPEDETLTDWQETEETLQEAPKSSENNKDFSVLKRPSDKKQMPSNFSEPDSEKHNTLPRASALPPPDTVSASSPTYSGKKEDFSMLQKQRGVLPVQKLKGASPSIVTHIDPNLTQEDNKIVPVGSTTNAGSAEAQKYQTLQISPENVAMPEHQSQGECFGRYQIKGTIGKGGMGKVLMAYDPALDRTVALKVLLVQEGSEIQIERFLREAKNTAKLKHPNIVTIYDVGVDGGKPYFTMEYIQGKPLSNLISELPVTKLMLIFEKVLRAVAYAHSFNVIHRDLKPANILVDDLNEPHILDFGLAKVMGETSLTQDGTIMGSPHYMSPEQAEGRISELSQTSDIYSLGIILYEILTGTQPFKGESIAQILVKILQQPPTPPRQINPDIPEDVERIILKAMEKDKEKRYPTVQAFLQDLKIFIESYTQEPIQQRRIALTEKRVRPSTKQPDASSLSTYSPTRQQTFEPAVNATLNVEQEAFSTPLASSKGKMDVVGTPAAGKSAMHVADKETLASDKAGVHEQPRPKPSAFPVALTGGVLICSLFIFAVSGFMIFYKSDEKAKGTKTVEQPSDPIKNPVNPGEKPGNPEEKRANPEEKPPEPKPDLSKHPDVPKTPDADGQSTVPDSGEKETKGWFGEDMPKGMKKSGVRGEYVWQKDGTVMVYVPEGEFWRGSEKGDLDEKPVSKINVDAFYMDKYELTWKLYKAYCGQTGVALPKSPTWGIADDHPVVNISWLDLEKYASWAGKRIPTEAEWEKSARGGLEIPNWQIPNGQISLRENPNPHRRFPHGENMADSKGKCMANYDGYDDKDGADRSYYKKDGFEYTAPAGSFPEGVSPYGCLDMSGNVWEWCSDWYEGSYKESVATNPKGPSNGMYRVCRGGSWYQHNYFCRTSKRFHFSPMILDDGLGGRLAKSKQ